MKRLFIMLCTFVALSWQSGLRAQEARTYYYQLISGSDHALPAAAQAKPIGAKLRNRLEAKFRWKHYAELSHGQCTLADNKTTSIRLPEKREMELQLVNAKTLEARLFRGKEMVRKTRENANAEAIIMGGDQGKNESWFIVIRRDKPSTVDTARAR
jgi:hypothetical protein